jgi:hypothetical protein
MAIANNDPRRAKVIWIKLQLKRNFPMTFREAMWPWAIDGNPPSTYPAPGGGYPTANPSNGTYPAFGAGVAGPISPSDLPPLKVFVDAYTSVVSATISPTTPTGVIAGPGTYSPDEASHLLYLSLSIEHRGAKFVPEQQLGPGAIYLDPSGQGGLSGFKDAWDQPIVFARWPTDFLDNLNVGGGDLQDTERTLMDANWNNQTLYTNAGPILGRNGVYWFEQLCHLVHNPNSNGTTPPWQQAYYAPPAIVSAGPNKRLGFYQYPAASGVFAPFYAPTVTPNFGMALDGTSDSNENIYNYTLK